MKALWDVATRPMTFDFCTFLVIAKTRGYRHIVIRYTGKVQAKKFPPEVAKARLKNILVPLCIESDTPFSYSGDGDELPYHAGDLERAYKDAGFLWKFQKTPPIVSGSYVTVTIRDSIRNEYRNSNRESWDRFIGELKARGRKVVVLEDREFDPISIAERLSLYSNADMNYGVNNGPSIMLYASEFPYRVFKMVPSYEPEPLRTHMAKGGFPEGSQFSFRTDNQRIVYEDDDFNALMKEIV